jgi:hypothetical protein
MKGIADFPVIVMYAAGFDDSASAKAAVQASLVPPDRITAGAIASPLTDETAEKLQLRPGETRLI